MKLTSSADAKTRACKQGALWTQPGVRRPFGNAACRGAYRLRPLAWAAALLGAVGGAQAVPVTWVGPDNGFWDVATNWSPGLPTLSSDALLGVRNTEFRSGNLALQSFTGSGRLTLSGGVLAPSAASSIGQLVMSGGTLDGDGAVTVTGSATWTGGALTGAGSTSFNSTLALNGNSRSRSISGRTVNLNGTTTWSAVNDGGGNPGVIAVSNGATLNNTGSWLDQVSVASSISASGNASTFNNSGSYTKNGTGTSDIQTVFNNTAAGTVTVNNSTLFLSGGGTLTGTLDAASGAALALNAGTFSLTGLSAGGGAGQFIANGGSVSASGSNAFGGTLGVAAGSMNVSGVFNANGYNGSGGTLTGTGAVNINGAATWTGGALTGAGSTSFNSTLALNGNSRSRSISGRTVNFNGTTIWSAVNDGGGNPGVIAVSNGAALNNTGSWLDQVSVASSISASGNASTFNNSGSYTKNGTGTSDIQTVFNNTATGTVTVNNSTLFLSGGGTLTGTLDAASGAALALNAGTFSLTGLSAGGGAGQLIASGGSVSASGSNAFGGTLGVAAGSMNVSGVFNANGYNGSGGALTGTGSVNINGAATWTGGALTGAGSTSFNSTLALNGNSRSRSISGRTVNFNGTTTWSAVNDGGGNPGVIAVSNGATLNNIGIWLDQVSVASSVSASGNASTFNNSGSYIKSGSVTTDLSAINYVNTGITDVAQGTLVLPANFANAGRLMGNGSLATNVLTNNGHIAPGESTGTLTISGSFVQAAQGTLDIELQSLASFDLLKITGSATLGGTLNLVCFADCTLALGQSFKILDAASIASNTSFANITWSGFAPGTFAVSYDRVNGDVLLNVVSVPEPGSWALLLAGSAVLVGLRRRFAAQR